MLNTAISGARTETASQIQLALQPMPKRSFCSDTGFGLTMCEEYPKNLTTCQQTALNQGGRDRKNTIRFLTLKAGMTKDMIYMKIEIFRRCTTEQLKKKKDLKISYDTKSLTRAEKKKHFFLHHVSRG